MKNLTLLGRDEYGSIQYAESREDGTLRGFSGYDLIYPEQSYDNYHYMSMVSWFREVTIDGVVYKTGDVFKAPEKLNISATDLAVIDEAIFNNVLYCSECYLAHESDQYMNPSFTIIDCEIFCHDCVDINEMLVPVTEAKDIFKAKDISNMEEPDLEEVETLFCDSSGMGQSRESALTQDELLQTVEDLMKKHGALVCGLTGIGQFQVYVTLYKSEVA